MKKIMDRIRGIRISAGLFLKSISWVLSAYFFVVFHVNLGFPPESGLHEGDLIYLGLFIFFFLIPIAHSVRLGSFLEYTAKVAEMKQDVKEFKEEIRNTVTVQSSLLSSVSQSVNHSVNVTLPSLSTAHEADEKLARTIHSASGQESRDAEMEYIEQVGGDINLALMRLRKELEVELRRILNVTTSFVVPRTKKFYSIGTLWNMFLAGNKDLKGIESAFFYVLDICNAAAHGQEVPEEHAEEALAMGLKIRDRLKHIEVQESSN